MSKADICQRLLDQGHITDEEHGVLMGAPMTDEMLRDLLWRVHELRLKAHWGKGFDVSRSPWPKTEAEWRQTPHGAPWDSNVHMAQWHLDFARKLQAEGLL